MKSDIGVVVVTYNRIEELQKTLRLFDRQTLEPRYVLVINNASTDGTDSFLSSWVGNTDERYQRYLITSETNEGGAGGFYRGLERSMDLDAEWVWVSDDDAYPFADTIEKAQSYLDSIRDSWNDYSAVCAGVLTEGGWNLNHRRMLSLKGKKIVSQMIPADKYSEPHFELNLFSYVGAIIRRDIMKTAGLTKKEYFIYFDDNEHSLRLSEYGKIVCVPAVRVYHYDPAEEKGSRYRWKIYYRIRNQYDMFRLHFPPAVYRHYYLGLYRKTMLQLIRNPGNYDAVVTKAALDDLRKRRFGMHAEYRPGAVIGTD